MFLQPGLALIPNPNKTRILVVDDEPDIAQSLHDYLVTQTNYQVSIAYDGAAARRALLAACEGPAAPFDLVLLDMRMPELSGGELLRWIRQHAALQYTRVIILAATTSTDERVEALSAGADDYITKPYHHQELLARVNTILRSHRLEKQLQHQSRQLALLNEASTVLTSLRDPKLVFEATVEGARQILDVELAAIFLFHERQGMLFCRQITTNHAPYAFPPVVASQGIVGHVFTQQQIVCLNNPSTDPRFALTDAPRGFPVRTLLAAPLHVRRRGVGVLLALNKNHGDFTDVDTALFTALSSAVGRAVENAWLFQSVRQQQQALLKGRDRLQAVIDGILHPIYTVDEQWRITAVNRSTLNEHNAPAVALVNQVCYRAFFQLDTPCAGCAVAETLRHKTTSGWVVRVFDDLRMPREWEVNAYPIPGPQTESAQAVVIWQDVTEKKRLEFSLAQADKLAAIGQLAAGITHEINNPLAVITAGSAMLRMSVPEEDDRYELVDLLVQASERANKVVRGLLDFARQEEYLFAPTDINESLRQALNLVSYQLQTAHIHVTMQLTPGLPSAFASADHLKTVWINLFINARDALQEQEGERQLDVITRLDDSGQKLQVVVCDNGVGMTQTQRERIFEPFYTTKAPGKGTGLGLSTSHRIVEQHGGTIEVISNAGNGTTFVVRLPISVGATD